MTGQLPSMGLSTPRRMISRPSLIMVTTTSMKLTRAKTSKMINLQDLWGSIFSPEKTKRVEASSISLPWRVTSTSARWLSRRPEILASLAKLSTPRTTMAWHPCFGCAWKDSDKKQVSILKWRQWCKVSCVRVRTRYTQDSLRKGRRRRVRSIFAQMLKSEKTLHTMIFWASI